MKVSVPLSIGSGVVAALLGLASSAHGQKALKTYKDPNYGVSFRYPASWISSSRVDLMMGTWILDDQDSATAIVTYAGRDARIQAGVVFTYLVLPHSTAE